MAERSGYKRLGLSERTLWDDVVLAKHIGAIIREQRELKGWSLNEMASACGIARPNYIRTEKGSHLPKLDTVLRCCVALHVDFVEVLSEAVKRMDGTPMHTQE